MPTDPEPTHPASPPRPKPGPEEFVVFEVDGFAQLTPEQRTWPVVPALPSPPEDGGAQPGEK
jgi:hypothetical protein